MKIRKRLLSLTLAVMLIVAMAVPASAYTVAMGRQWSGFSYGTSDTCNARSYYCTIEGMSNEYTLRTDVNVYWQEPSFEPVFTYYTGSTGTLLSAHSRSVNDEISYMYSYHYLGGTYASSQRVEAG